MDYRELIKVTDSEGSDFQLYWEKNEDTKRNEHVSEWLCLRTASGMEGRVGGLAWYAFTNESGRDCYAYYAWVAYYNEVTRGLSTLQSGISNSADRAKQSVEEKARQHMDAVVLALEKILEKEKKYKDRLEQAKVKRAEARLAKKS